jgi:tetratricopeptide (TPR) repeat protein
MQAGKAAGILLASCIALLILFSCASTPKKETTGSAAAEVNTDTSGAVAIPIPKKTSRSYFSSIEKKIRDLAEIGSPESLKQAASLLHKTDDADYDENERVLLATCAGIMSIVWPSETVSWEIPTVTESTPYLGAIDSARRGIYDYSTGNTDFLTLVLPSLVLLTSDTRNDYYSDANAALSSALSMRDNSVLANYLMGVLRRKQKRYSDSLTYFSRAVELAPECFETLYARADAYSRNGRNETALENGEALLETNVQNVDVLKLCAKSAFNLGNVSKAEQYVARVLQVEPENTEYVLFRARILMDKGDYIKASSLLDVSSRNDKTSIDYLLLRARLQRDWNKNTAAAGQTIEQALSLYPDNYDVLIFAAQLASSANITIGGRNALTIAGQILGMDKNNLEAKLISITEMTKNGEWENAYLLSTQLLADKKTSQSIVYTHIDICLALKKNSEANRLASSLYEASPNDENVQQTYIKVLVAFGQKDESLKLINRLLPTANSKMKSFLLYEKSYFAADSDTMLSDLRSSLTSNPRNRDALYRLYEIYYEKKDWRKAQYYLKQVVALNPTDTAILKRNDELDKLIQK